MDGLNEPVKTTAERKHVGTIKGIGERQLIVNC